MSSPHRHPSPARCGRRALLIASPARRLRHGVGAALMLALAVACSTGTDAPTAARSPATAPDAAALDAHAGHPGHAGGTLTAEQRQAVAQVRRATARLHSIDVAKAAGYTAQYPVGCASSPAGGQGYHYLDPSKVDARVELLEPELVMYEPQPGGGMQLVGVDYVVPFTAWTSDEPPTLLGVPFMRLEPLGVWALHIWAWRPNPSGMFTAWNPQVSCANAR